MRTGLSMPLGGLDWATYGICSTRLPRYRVGRRRAGWARALQIRFRGVGGFYKVMIPAQMIPSNVPQLGTRDMETRDSNLASRWPVLVTLSRINSGGTDLTGLLHSRVLL